MSKPKLIVMKKLILLAAVIIGLAGCKKSDTSPSTTQTITDEQLNGTWNGPHVLHYTDSNGASKTVNDGSYNSLIFSKLNKSVIKGNGGVREFFGTYAVRTSGSTSYFDFTVTSPSAVYTYKINSITTTTLSVNGPVMATWSAIINGITYSGTNAYYEETYTKQ